jgi:hypothetical protein
LLAWEAAHERVVGPKARFALGSSYTSLELLRDATEARIATERRSLLRSPQALKLYQRCVQEIADKLNSTIEEKRRDLAASFRKLELDADPDLASPLPVWRERSNYLRGLVNDIEIKLKHPEIQSARDIYDAAINAIESDHLVAPPPKAHVVTGSGLGIPGGGESPNLSAARANNAALAEPANFVPKEVDRAIRQQLVEQQNKHFREQERQVEEELARQAELAKERQAQPVGA